MNDNRQLLYEKIVEKNDQLRQLMTENDQLKIEIENIKNYNKEEMISLIETCLSATNETDEETIIELDEKLFGEKTEEERMAKYIVKIINDKAKEYNLDPKKIVELISQRIKG